jgi:hypothetical protein
MPDSNSASDTGTNKAQWLTKEAADLIIEARAKRQTWARIAKRLNAKGFRTERGRAHSAWTANWYAQAQGLEVGKGVKGKGWKKGAGRAQAAEAKPPKAQGRPTLAAIRTGFWAEVAASDLPKSAKDTIKSMLFEKWLTSQE